MGELLPRLNTFPRGGIAAQEKQVGSGADHKNAEAEPATAAGEAGYEQLPAALEEARALIETAEQDGYVSAGWREDARRWQECWFDAL